MIDPTTISTGIGIGKNIIQLADWLKNISDTSVISAFFDYQGSRKYGSEKIKIELIKNDTNATVWWYSINPVEDYVFVRFPIIESGVYEIIGTVQGENNSDSRYWRYVPEPIKGRLYKGEDVSNTKVDFIIIGYRPKAVIKYFSTQ